jgi:uncharacterized protein YndB with AHSA1/START domain
VSTSRSIYIEAPVEKVFAWFKDPRNWLTLNPSDREEITQAHVPPEGLGTFHVWRMRPLRGIRFEIFGVFTEYEPNQRIVDRWSMALEGTETYGFEREGSGTRMTLSRERRSLWRLKILDRLLDQVEGREDQRALTRLKQRMESTVEAAVAAG